MPKRTAPVASTDRRIDKLLALLSEHPMVVLSGAKIARQIGVSRSAVWHWVQKLREHGVRIKGHPKAGYQLETTPDILVPQLLRQRLEGTPFARRIHHFFRTDSTNSVALQLAADGEPHGALVVAEEQTAGRGRLGRAWFSEKTSGIYLSILLRPTLALQQAPLLTLAAGLAARDAVVEATRSAGSGQAGLSVDLRWPNDLLINGKKFGGILTEMQAEANRLRHVVVGIGINVNHTKMPAELEAIATSLRRAGLRPYSRLEIVVGLLRAFDRYYNRLLEEGASPIIGRFMEVSSFAQGKRVRVATAREEFTGTTAGLDAMGCLLVRRDNGQTVPVLAGDIREE